MGPVSKELARRFTKWSGRFRQGTETLPSVKDDASMNRRDFLTAVGSATMTGTGLCGGSSVTEPEPAVRYRVIDAHVHVFNTWHKLPTHFDGVPRTSATVENTVAALDAGGVEKAFLITYTSLDIGRGMPPGVDPVKSLPVYSKQYGLKAWHEHRDRFYWFTDHVDPSRQGYLADLRRDLELGADGVKILSAFHGFLPDHPGFTAVYELCRQFHKPVIIDGSFWYFTHMPPLKESASRQKLGQTIAGYAKMLADVFGQFPTVPFSLAHTGTASRMSDYREIYPLIANHANVSCDVAASLGYGASWLVELVRAVGAEKVMYGTDWPYWSTGRDSYLTGPRCWTMVAHQCPQLAAQEKQWILADNAERFVRNQLPTAAKETKTESPRA